MTFDVLVLMRLRADDEDEELIVTTSDTKRHKERRENSSTITTITTKRAIKVTGLALGGRMLYGRVLLYI